MNLNLYTYIAMWWSSTGFSAGSFPDYIGSDGSTLSVESVSNDNGSGGN